MGWATDNSSIRESSDGKRCKTRKQKESDRPDRGVYDFTGIFRFPIGGTDNEQERQKILFLDDDGQEIEFNVIEQTTIAGQTYLLVEDCEASSEDESVVLIMKEVQLEDDYVSYEIVEDDKELDMISDIFNALLDGLEVSLKIYKSV